jgi:hypothetical protein
MNENVIVNNALDRLLDQTGIKGTWTLIDKDIDGELDLYFDRKKERFFVEVKKELRNFQMPAIFEEAERNQPFMVIAERIFPTLKEILREKNIGYLDGAGNIYVKTPHHYIWLDGNKALEPEKPATNRAFTKTGLRLLFYLLLYPDRINAPYRHFHMATHIALGNIKNIMDGLQEAGFIININKREVALQNKRQLLERWITAYQETLKPALHIGNFRFANRDYRDKWQDLPIDTNKTKWGGEAGADILTNYLTPQVLTIYTTEKKNELIPKLKLIPDPNGDINAYERFWYDEEQNPLNYVPPLLVYADLMITGDPRCIETAEIIYKEHLANEFE